MAETTFLSTEDVLALIRKLGIGPVRDLGLVDAAVARPRASAFGSDAYPTLALKAAALLESLTGNHALVDGNKRIAWLASVVFCDLNGHPVVMEDDDAFQLVIDIAEHTVDLEEIAARLSARWDG